MIFESFAIQDSCTLYQNGHMVALISCDLRSREKHGPTHVVVGHIWLVAGEVAHALDATVTIESIHGQEFLGTIEHHTTEGFFSFIGHCPSRLVFSSVDRLREN